jgi:hypothetical protein
MKIKRRFLPAVALLPVLLTAIGAPAAENPPSATNYFVYVGTYTAKTHSKGIYLFEFSPATGKFTPKGVAAATPDPSWSPSIPTENFS